MATGFVRGGHWTPCDVDVIIRRCDRDGLITYQRTKLKYSLHSVTNNLIKLSVGNN